MVDSSLVAIQNKVRRLTRSLSESVLTTDQLNEYINTFILYDFPEQIRLFNLKETFSFYTIPYVDFYPESTLITDPLYQFNQKYLTVNPPIYIAGYQALFVESRDKFYGIYPKLASIASIGVAGNGTVSQFSGVVNSQQAIIPPNLQQTITLLPYNVLFNSIDINNNGLALIDIPISNTIGNLYVPGTTPVTDEITPDNFINYLTGEFTITFATPPGAGQIINSQTVPQQPSLPQSMLFFDGSFTLRPVPDQVYKVQMEVFIRPTEFMQDDSAASPKLEEWWQYIAYGAAKKVFEDRMDLESVQLIMPEFKTQERLCLRRTIVQQTSQRVATIYSEDNGSAGAYGPGWFSGGGSF
jgi:hypothetical protein